MLLQGYLYFSVTFISFCSKMQGYRSEIFQIFIESFGQYIAKKGGNMVK